MFARSMKPRPRHWLALTALGLGCARAVDPPVDTDASIFKPTEDAKFKPYDGDPYFDDLAGEDVDPTMPPDDGLPFTDRPSPTVDSPAPPPPPPPPAPPPPPPPPPTRCGSPGLVCCTGARCDVGATCMGGLCAEQPSCGVYNQPCCGSAACGPGLSCVGGRCTTMAACGASGQACCTTGSFCQPLLLCTGSRCVPCGNPGQSCCAGTPTCNRTLRCETSLCVM